MLKVNFILNFLNNLVPINIDRTINTQSFTAVIHLTRYKTAYSQEFECFRKIYN